MASVTDTINSRKYQSASSEEDKQVVERTKSGGYQTGIEMLSTALEIFSAEQKQAHIRENRDAKRAETADKEAKFLRGQVTDLSNHARTQEKKVETATTLFAMSHKREENVANMGITDRIRGVISPSYLVDASNQGISLDVEKKFKEDFHKPS